MSDFATAKGKLSASMSSATNDGQRCSNCQGNMRTLIPPSTTAAKDGHFDFTIAMETFPFDEIDGSSLAAPKWTLRNDWNVWLHVSVNESSDPFITGARHPPDVSANLTLACSYASPTFPGARLTSNARSHSGRLNPFSHNKLVLIGTSAALRRCHPDLLGGTPLPKFV